MRFALRFAFPLVVVALCGAAVTAALGSRAAPAAAAFTLVQMPKSECLDPKNPKKVILGKACLDKSQMILPANWKVSDGSAQWSPTGWTTTYSWSVPASIPPAGAAIKLGLTAQPKQASSICPAIGQRGFVLKSAAQGPDLSICATQGKGASGSKTLTILPPSSGPAYLVIGLSDGPRLTYKYAVGAQKPQTGCRKPASARTSAGLRTRELEPPFKVSFDVIQKGVPERGESPTLAGTEMRGSGLLTICTKLPGQAALATLATGKIVHNDIHELPGAGLERHETLELTVTRGAYGVDDNWRRVALDVVVTKSKNDLLCPVGSVGRLVLSFDRKGGQVANDHEVWLRLCGTNHTHRLKSSTFPRRVLVALFIVATK